MADLETKRDGYVATIEFQRPPNNFFDATLVRDIADALHALDRDPECRAVVLAAAGKHFCAGADVAKRLDPSAKRPVERHVYEHAIHLVRSRKPIVAAVHGAAIGGGMGLALVADFRITCPEARFSANFANLGYHPGFGMTFTLPRLVGVQAAARLFYSGARIDGAAAHGLGLADELVAQSDVRARAIELAREIAASGPLAIVALRASLRGDFAERFAAAAYREAFEQAWLRDTKDFREGVTASGERRTPEFSGE